MMAYNSLPTWTGKIVQELARADLAAGRSIYLTFFLAKLFKTVKRHLMTTDVFFIA
jgi:hypothetical protein|nr:MAG TPA: hypothetical protein [Caudoviricetes sp.]